MKNFSVRLAEKQFENIQELAKSEHSNPNQIIRELIEIGLKQKKLAKRKKSRLTSIPAYEILATRASIDILILLREMVKITSPDLIDKSKKLARDLIEKKDLAELIEQ